LVFRFDLDYIHNCLWNLFSSLYLCTYYACLFLLLNFDFVLRNREDLEKKGFTGRLLYDLIFHCLLLVLILDDFTVVELSFVSHAEGFTRPFLHASPTAFLRLMLLKPEIVVSSPCIRPQPLRALCGVGPVRIED